MVAETEAEMVEVTAVDPDSVGCNRTDEIDILGCRLSPRTYYQQHEQLAAVKRGSLVTEHNTVGTSSLPRRYRPDCDTGTTAFSAHSGAQPVVSLTLSAVPSRQQSPSPGADYLHVRTANSMRTGKGAA